MLFGGKPKGEKPEVGKPKGEKSSSNESKDPKSDLERCTENHRFLLAVILVVGFLILIGIAMLGGYNAPIDLAGIFSGWIVAIIGFYFLEQSSERAVAQQSTALSREGQQKLDILVEVPDLKFDNLVKKTEERIGKLEDEKNRYLEIAEKYRKVIQEMIEEDKDTNE